MRRHKVNGAFKVVRLAMVALIVACGGSGDSSDPPDAAPPAEDYVLLHSQGYEAMSTALIDRSGTVVHLWNHDLPHGQTTYLLDNGNLLTSVRVPDPVMGEGGGWHGVIREIDKDSNVVWEFEYNDELNLAHHDIEPMPNGNVLVTAWELKTVEESIAAGRATEHPTWPDSIVEVDRTTSEVVWKWSLWDHLIQEHDETKDNYGVVAEHPELLDINTGHHELGVGGDWIHMNGLSYNPELDQIAFSSHWLHEVYVIDHSTANYDDPQAGIDAAAGHTGGNSGRGGDILYRWGNPGNYQAPGDVYFSVVHSSIWIPAGYVNEGNLLALNNGQAGHSSEVVELDLPKEDDGSYSYTAGEAYGPETPTWTYADPDNFYTNHQGAVRPMHNGNVLVTETTAERIFEVNRAGEVLWEHERTEPIQNAQLYLADHPGIIRLLE